MAVYEGKWIVSRQNLKISGAGYLKDSSILDISATQATVTKADGTTANIAITLTGNNFESQTQPQLAYPRIKGSYIPYMGILTGWVTDDASNTNLHAFTAVRSPLDGHWVVSSVEQKGSTRVIKDGSLLKVDGRSVTYVKSDGNSDTLTVAHDTDTLAKVRGDQETGVRLAARLITTGGRCFLLGSIGYGTGPIVMSDADAGCADDNTDAFTAVKISA